MPSLQPMWRPIPLPAPVDPGAGPRFPLVVDDGTGVVIVGGPEALHVFQVHDRQRHWFSIQALASISGFAVHEGELYVQDGAVLSCWNLVRGQCLASVNLVTGEAVEAAAGLPLETLERLQGVSAPTPRRFSIPVVRRHQLGGPPAGMVFVLDSEGCIYLLDPGLSAPPRVHRGAPPAVLALAMEEKASPQDPNTYLCHLFYAAVSGEVWGLDVSTLSPVDLGRWPSKGSPEPGCGIPPAYADGLLWMGGWQGPGIQALPPIPGEAAVVSIPEPSGPWTSLEISQDEHLVYACSGTMRQLFGYGHGLQVRGRWAGAPTQSWPLFWHAPEGAGADQPLLLLEVDRSADPGGNPGFRVFVANTVDAPPEQVLPNYPPDPLVLASGTLEPGPFTDILPRLVSLVVPPLVTRNEMFVLADAGEGHLVFLAFALTTLAQAVTPAAVAELARLGLLARPLPVEAHFLTHHMIYHDYLDDHIILPDTRETLANTTLVLQLETTPPSTLTFTTDAQGRANLEGLSVGLQASVSPDTIAALGAKYGSTCVLSHDKLNSFELQRWESHRVSGGGGGGGGGHYSNEVDDPGATPLPVPEELALLWTFPNPFGSLEQPLLAAGDRLIGTAQGTVFALDLYDGQPVGPTEVRPKCGFPYSLSSYLGGDPFFTAAGGSLFFMDGDRLVALRLADGQPLEGWQPPQLGQVTALFATEGRVVAVSLDATGATLVSGIDAVSGRQAFEPVKVSQRSPGKLTCAAGALFFVADDAPCAVNIDFGDRRWSAPARPGQLDPSVVPLVTDKVVLFASTELVALDLRKGVQRWSVKPRTTAAGRWLSPVADPSGGRAIAVHTGGDILSIDLTDGSIAWRTTLDSPGAPAVVRDHVCIPFKGNQLLAIFEAGDGKPRAAYVLPDIAADQAPVVANGSLCIACANGTISARSFATQDAAFFDGKTSRIDIQPDGTQFDFGLGDFTVETWFRSSVGGELLSSYPTRGQDDAHGFRLNLGPRGELRMAVMNARRQNLEVGRTSPTGAVDGAWHHVALLRSRGSFRVLLDGQSLQVHTPVQGAGQNALGGASALTLGAYLPAPGAEPEEHFYGLLREVRIWEGALDATTLDTNRMRELTGREPGLRGLWHLDEVQVPGKAVEPVNAVLRHRSAASFLNPASRPTDLDLDRGAFPYLLPEARHQWPYDSPWAARGESPALALALLAGGVLVFSTNNAVYGVRRTDGGRLWALDLAEGSSAPVADGSSVLLMTGEEALVCIDAYTGAKLQVPGFERLASGASVSQVAPAVNSTYLAAASPQGQILLADRRPGGPTRSLVVPGTPQSLVLGPSHLLVTSAVQGVKTLTVFETTSGKDLGTRSLADDPICLEGGWLVCSGPEGLQRLDLDCPGLPVAARYAGTAPGTITGLAASKDADLLVVTRATGLVEGLSLAKLCSLWSVQLGTEGPRAVNAPVLDAQGRVFCTTQGGIVAVLEGGSGSLLGRYNHPQPVVTPALVEAGTAYFACQDPTDPHADCDGAIHSLIVGQTLALRLGVDANGTPLPEPSQYALVDAETEASTLHLLEVDQSCLEAWVNIPPPKAGSRVGGGILGICPSTEAGFDVNLSVDPTGLIHYHSRTLAKDGWQRLHASVPSKLCDGAWHHLAVSRGLQANGASLAIFVDGHELPGVVTEVKPGAPSATVTGLRAFLGACCGADCAPTLPFVGMLGEVRVWDTWLGATEIAERMHTKLRGNEPDLIACWDFDRGMVHDAALQGHDGVLVPPEPAWWLTDLPFQAPSYPQLQVAASLVQEGDATHSTVYTLELTARRADGGPLASEPLDLWYVRHEASEPVEITINGSPLTGVPLGQEPEGALLRVQTGPNGIAKLRVETSLPGHGPSLDVRSSFMPAHERLHVNCLIDNQLLAKPVPPRLVVQSKLIQDYHYSPGNVVDETRDRSTYRIILTACNPDHSVRPHEPITLWAESEVTLEVGTQAYCVNKDNGANLMASAMGEVVVVLEAEGLVAPRLFARAGFMHGNDRIVISPAEDAHAQLSKLQGSTLTTPKLVNWKPNAQSSDQKVLLAGDYSPHAEKVATAVRTVMTSVKPPAASTMGRRQLANTLAAPPTYEALRQPLLPPRGDRRQPLRTLVGVDRRAPLDRHAFAAALEGNLGFVFDCSGDTLRYELLGTLEALDRERGQPSPLPEPSNSIFDNIWDGIQDTATDIYHGATKIVISAAEALGNQIQIAIHTLVDGVASVVHTVVDSVEAAVQAVVAFFKQLILDIRLLILFLRALFDWGAMRDAAKLLSRLLERMSWVLAGEPVLGPMRTVVHGAFQRFEEALGMDTSQLTGSAHDNADEDAGDDSPTGITNGVQGRMLFHKLQDHGGEATAQGFSAAVALPVSALEFDPLQPFLSALASVVGDLATANLQDAQATVLNLLKLLPQEIFANAEAWVIGGLESVVKSLKGVLKLLATDLDIPFISALYEWIFGMPLTILNVTCLVVAVPLHIAYYVGTLGSKFSDDATNLFLPPSDGANQGEQPYWWFVPLGNDTKDWEIVYAVTKAIHILAVLGTDLTFSRYGEGFGRGLLKILRGVCGVFTCFWAFAFTLGKYFWELDKKGYLSDKSILDQPWLFDTRRYLGLILALLADGITLVAGVWRLKQGAVGGAAPIPGIEMVGPAPGGPAPGQPDMAWAMAHPPAPAGPQAMPTGRMDEIERYCTRFNAVLALVQITLQIWAFTKSPEYSDDDLKTPGKLLGSRFILFACPKLVGWMYTQTTDGDLLNNPTVRASVAGARFATNTAGLVCHSVAGFNYLT